MNIRISILSLSLLVLLVSCKAQESHTTAFQEMLDGMYKGTVPLAMASEIESKDYLVLDTREKEEFDVSHLPGAVWVGFKDFQEEKLETVSKDQPILVYCSVGYRSERIGEKLQKRGFTDVHNLYGGIFDWYDHGNTVLNASETATDSVHTYNRKWSQWLQTGVKVW